MTELKTLKDLKIAGHDIVRVAAIKQIRDGLTKGKNFFKLFMKFHNLTGKDLTR